MTQCLLVSIVCGRTLSSPPSCHAFHPQYIKIKIHHWLWPLLRTRLSSAWTLLEAQVISRCEFWIGHGKSLAVETSRLRSLILTRKCSMRVGRGLPRLYTTTVSLWQAKGLVQDSFRVLRAPSTKPVLISAPQISFTHGNAQDLPKHIEDNSIDLYTIAFGIRNCTSLPAVLSEAYRVLKPGGKIGVLEFGKVSNPLFRE